MHAQRLKCIYFFLKQVPAEGLPFHSLQCARDRARKEVQHVAEKYQKHRRERLWRFEATLAVSIY